MKGGWSEDTSDVILNEAAVQRMRFKDPINQVIFWNGHHKIHVIGVVKNALMTITVFGGAAYFFSLQSLLVQQHHVPAGARSGCGSGNGDFRAYLFEI